MSALARRLYVVTWLALAAVGLVYFADLYRQSDLPGAPAFASLKSVLSWGDSGPQTPVETADPAVAQALTRMNVEIERLKSDLESSQKENAALRAHLRTFEQTYGPTTAALPPEPRQPRMAREKQPEKSAGDDEQIKVQVMTMPLPSTGFIDELEESPLPIANASKPMRTVFAVQLADGLAARSVDTKWKELTSRHGKLFTGLTPRRVKSKNGTTYGLIAGPFDNAAASALMCARLSIVRVDCASTVFTGEPLDTVANR